MKTSCLAPFLGMVLTTVVLRAQLFDPGSDGSLGDFTTSAGTTVIPLPPDGVLHYKSFRVNSGHTVYFQPNAANTPAYVLASGDIVIEGAIGIDGGSGNAGQIQGGLGGPGGFRGGNGLATGQLPGAGQGPGGGAGATSDTANDANAGAAGHLWSPNNARGSQNGAAYGSTTLIPLVGGSGGGGAWQGGGGGGGGALLLASATRIHLTGNIYARGGGGPNENGGSGGAVRLVAPSLTGGGGIDVAGSVWGAAGRIRIDSPEARSPAYTFRGAGPSIGSLMLTGLNLPGAPRLSILQVGGQAVTPGAAGAVSLTLPIGSNPLQNLVVEAANFGRVVPVRVVLAPDHGPRVVVDAEIDNSAVSVIRSSIPVTFPVNVTTRVNVWTR